MDWLRKNNISLGGLILSFLGLVIMTGLFYQISGFWCLFWSPLTALMMCRPVDGGSRWMWQES